MMMPIRKIEYQKGQTNEVYLMPYKNPIIRKIYSRAFQYRRYHDKNPLPSARFRLYPQDKQDHRMKYWKKKINTIKKLGGKCTYPRCNIDDPRLLTINHTINNTIEIRCWNHNWLWEYDRGRFTIPTLSHK